MVLSADGRGDPQFLHAVLCQLGLPRNPTREQDLRADEWPGAPLAAGGPDLRRQEIRRPAPALGHAAAARAHQCVLGGRAHARARREYRRQRARVHGAAQHRSRRREHGAVPQADAGAQLLPYDARDDDGEWAGAGGRQAHRRVPGLAHERGRPEDVVAGLSPPDGEILREPDGACGAAGDGGDRAAPEFGLRARCVQLARAPAVPRQRSERRAWSPGPR